MKTSWRIFAGGRPGLRFRERHRLRQSRGYGGLHPVRLAYLAGGAGLIVVSAVFGWMPVLGWGTVVLGLAMIAGEVQWVARLMDRWEVAARGVLGPAAETVGRGAGWVGPPMLAGGAQWGARLMDRWGVAARRLLGPPAKTVGRLPVWAQLCVSLTGALATFALVYGLYSLALGAHKDR